ncbi:MAG: sigma-70 family RNA polymerase sigma factor [Xanthomonadales bacterium]|nr:sigma-70 family RNA polymerase sigma factor [Xanthomonadales bacterium]
MTPVPPSMDDMRMQRDVSTSTLTARDPAYWDSAMLAVVKRRDKKSFLFIYDHFMPRVLRYMMNLGASQAVAEDLAQEALLRVWQRASAFDPARASLSTWLFRIARNLHIDRVRREPYWVPIQEGLAHLEQAIASTSTSESYAEAAGLRRQLDQLPANQARMIRMSYFEGKSHREIATELGLPLGTVKSGLRRAFMQLQIHMKAKP